jgi:hypothetical protein
VDLRLLGRGLHLRLWWLDVNMRLLNWRLHLDERLLLSCFHPARQARKLEESHFARGQVLHLQVVDGAGRAPLSAGVMDLVRPKLTIACPAADAESNQLFGLSTQPVAQDGT